MAEFSVTKETAGIVGTVAINPKHFSTQAAMNAQSTISRGQWPVLSGQQSCIGSCTAELTGCSASAAAN